MAKKDGVGDVRGKLRRLSRPTRLWGYVLCISVGVVMIIVDVRMQSSIQLTATAPGNRSSVGNKVIVHSAIEGEQVISFADFPLENYNQQIIASVNDGPSAIGGETSIDEIISTESEHKAGHPRIICFSASCDSLEAVKRMKTSSVYPPSDSAVFKWFDGKPGKSSQDALDLFDWENDECTLSDPSYQAQPAAPSSCNEVHAFGLSGDSLGGRYPSITFLDYGGYNVVFTVQSSLEGKFIMKTHKYSKGFGRSHWDRNRRDALVSEKAGKPATDHDHNVLPLYQFCQYTTVAQFATKGPLDNYVSDYYYNNKKLMNAAHMLQLAVQAAQGLYQMHLYKDGKATHVHADIKPSQFLLFEPDDPSDPPILQLNDFNRGQFLTRSRRNNETCPFFVCGVTHKGSRYRSPEEYSDCAEQRDSIDVYSLGGVFYFLLSDGMKPWYYIKSFDSAVKEIQKGRQSSLPPADAYEEAFGENFVAYVKERSSHPAFLALKEVMEKCWAFNPTDRPSSLKVVEMLKAKIHELNL